MSKNEIKEKPKGIVRQKFDGIIKVITSSINPVVPLLAGAGMGKVLLIVLELLNILSVDGSTYKILKFIFDTPFYFLPALVAFSAGKVFNVNRYISGFLGLVLLHPNFVELVKLAEPVTFLGLPVALNKYSAQVVPAILMVWIYSFIEPRVNKVVPKSVSKFIAPMINILIMAPLGLMLIAPIGMTLGNWIAQGVLWFSSHFGFIAIALLAAVYPWLVTMGLHKGLSPISIMLVAQQGYDPVIRVIALCSNVSQGAAALAVSFKAKNEDLKSIARAGAITALLGGFTQTALYGVNLQLKKPMKAAMIGAATSGVYAGIVGLKAYAYITPAILSLPMWIGFAGNYLVQAVITLLISTIVTFTLTLIFGFDESEYQAPENLG